MENNEKLIYFFDNLGQLIRVADDVFEHYADSITGAKFMHAQVEEPVFKLDIDNNVFEKFMKAAQGEEATDEGPVQSMKHILCLTIDKKGPIEEIDKCLWIGGGWIEDYDDEWYDMNTIEDLTYVSDKNRVMDTFKHSMRNKIKMAGG